MTIGRLYGLGLGPGDPELVTLKALRLLRAVPVVAYPAPEHEYVMPPAEKRLFQDQLAPAPGTAAPKR